MGDGADGLGRSGSLSGTFNVTLNQPSTLRQLFVLYENGGTSGVGTVDGVKIGFGFPGDANLDGSIDINDVFQIAPHFNTGPEYSGTSHVTTNNWRTGDFIGDGNVDVRDINLLRENYGLNYSTSPAISPVKPAVLAIGGLRASGIQSGQRRRGGRRTRTDRRVDAGVSRRPVEPVRLDRSERGERFRHLAGRLDRLQRLPLGRQRQRRGRTSATSFLRD